MAQGDTVICVVGNLVEAPELRFTHNGHAVANFTIASTPRVFNRDSNQWDNGDALFMRCTIWRHEAENVAESLSKGMRVIAKGRLKQRSYETREGEKRTVVELEVDEIGPSLKFATAQVSRATSGQGGGSTFTAKERANAGAPPADDPWGNAQAFAGGSNEVPF